MPVFFYDPATPETHTLSLHDALPIFPRTPGNNVYVGFMVWSNFTATKCRGLVSLKLDQTIDRKSGSAGMPRPTSYAVFCLKKKIDQCTTRSANRNAHDAKNSVTQTHS